MKRKLRKKEKYIDKRTRHENEQARRVFTFI